MMRVEYLKIRESMKMAPAKPFTVRLVDWGRMHEALAEIRLQVFVEEQNVPAEIVMDGLDADGVHAAARDADGNVIGSARLIMNQAPPRIGLMAVLKKWRSAGAGGEMLEQLCGAAKLRGFNEVMVHSQTHASPFYFRHGFLSYGSEFFEAGIPHQEMRKRI